MEGGGGYIFFINDKKIINLEITLLILALNEQNIPPDEQDES